MPYVAQQAAQIRRAAEMEQRRIPDGVDFRDMAALRAETRQALAKFRPTTFGQASRLEGVTPADVISSAVSCNVVAARLSLSWSTFLAPMMMLVT